MSLRSLEQIAERARRVPRLPDAALRLVRVISDPLSTIGEIVETIRYDQAVTVEVLRLCNSAYFGLTRRVHSLDDAVRLLGTTKVLQLVMAAHVQSTLSRPQDGYGLRPGALWEHSVGVALASRALAVRLKLREMGLCFTAGLLHDVGKVALNEYVRAEYAEIVRRVTNDGLAFPEAERQVLGYTHAELGAHLSELWCLPPAVTRAARHHHEPDALEPPDPLVDIVHLADAMCLSLGVGGGAVDGLAYRVAADVMTRCRLSARDLEGLGVDVVVELKVVQQLFATQS